MNLKTKYSLVVLFSFIPFAAYAIDIATISNTFYQGGTLIARIIHICSVISGVVMLAASIAGYREHLRNPKFIPLDRPLIFLVLGLVMLALPFASRFVSESANPLDKSVQQNKQLQKATIDPDAPLP